MNYGSEAAVMGRAIHHLRQVKETMERIGAPIADRSTVDHAIAVLDKHDELLRKKANVKRLTDMVEASRRRDDAPTSMGRNEFRVNL